MKKNNAILQKIFFGALIALTACSQPEHTITIVSTNDVHAHIENFPRLATLVEQQRAANPGRTLLIDAGDRWTGNPYVDLAEKPGKPVIELMDRLGYDIATFGNHEFDFGVPTLAERTAEAGFDKVMANADASQSAMPAIAPYRYIDVDGLRIAVLGLITVEPHAGHPVGKSESYATVSFTDPLATADSYAWLADSSDLYIALTHIGFEEDSLLALRRPEIDLILGGHSHTMVPTGRRIGNAVVTQTGRNLKYAGITTITYSGRKVRRIENSLVLLDTIAPNPAYEAMVTAYYNEPHLAEPVGRLTAGINKIGLMNLFTDAMREGTGADFAFHNMGGMRIDSLPAGDIPRGQIYAAEPFRNSPVVARMTEEQIKALIINKFNSTGKESHTLDIYPSGLTYEIETDSEGNAFRVRLKHHLYPEIGKEYIVAMSDYMFEQYDFTNDGLRKYDGGPITYTVFNYLKKHSPLTAGSTNRVSITTVHEETDI